MRLIYFDVETLQSDENQSIFGIGAVTKKNGRHRGFYKTLLDPRKVKTQVLRKYRLQMDKSRASNTREILTTFLHWITPDSPRESVILVSLA